MTKLLKQEDVDSIDDESVGGNPKEVSVEEMIKGDEDIYPPQHKGRSGENQNEARLHTIFQ